MADVLAEIGGVRLTIRTAGITVSLLILVLFMLIRTAMNKKAPGDTPAFSRWMDSAGFGLLPAAAAWKIFETIYAAAGREVIEPLPMLPWLTESGRFIPGAIETAAALICFAGICCWLMFRKEEKVGRGDLLMVSLCAWSGIRVITESFREPPDNILRYIYCAAVLICFGVWTARQKQLKRLNAAAWLAAILCTAMIVLTTCGTLSTGSMIGDLAAVAGCTVLTVLLTLLCGSDQRDAESGIQNAGPVS